MAENDPQIEDLERRLDSLVKTQISFQTEIVAIRQMLAELRRPQGPDAPETAQLAAAAQPLGPAPEPPPLTQKLPPPEPDPIFSTEPARGRSFPPPPELPGRQPGAFPNYVTSARADSEKFIGQNLISLIGIIILMLGVGIGAKYAIDNGWISPILRIGIAYTIGIALIGVALRLKSKYLNFSAVLISGGMAILYFVTYFAYAAYFLIPQPVAFGLMAIFTVLTVAAALIYSRQVIAHIGLVGAYAVPFLLSNNSGQYAFLFAYMAIINLGILAISLKKYWKPLFYTASGFTWLIFLAWLSTRYVPAEHFELALTFLAIFFGIFYVAKIASGLLHPQRGDGENLIAALVTTVIFYAFALAISDAPMGGREYTVMFSYLAVASLGVLVTSFRYYGRALVLVAYPFTWLIYGVWFATRFDQQDYFLLAAVFAGVFFAIFYGATLLYRLLTDEIGMIENAGLVLTNSFVFYGFGYAILNSRESLQPYEGLFTAAHGALHAIIAQLVNRFRTNAIDVVQVLAVLIITFTTIAIPVQFQGNRVTLVWTVEAAVLFFFGRVRGVRFFEYFSYPLMCLASGSLAVVWVTSFAQRTSEVSEWNLRPFVNGDFVTALVFVAAFGFIYFINSKKDHEPAVPSNFVRPLGMIIGAITLAALYNTFRVEISNYHHILSAKALATSPSENGAFIWSGLRSFDIERFNTIWQIDYTMLFFAVLALFNIRRIRSEVLAYANIVLSMYVLIIFLTIGMNCLYELRLTYMDPEAVRTLGSGMMNIAIRYVSYVFTGGLLVCLSQYSRSELVGRSVSRARRTVFFELLIYPTIFVAASCELSNLMAQFYIPDASKLGLSILWGVYALVLIVLGIAWSKKYLRIGALAIFAVTLVKLFFYDIADLPTIPKTILFVSLGLLLLLVSFLYNKYKNVMFPPVAEEGK